MTIELTETEHQYILGLVKKEIGQSALDGLHYQIMADRYKEDLQEQIKKGERESIIKETEESIKDFEKAAKLYESNFEVLDSIQRKLESDTTIVENPVE